MPMTNLAFDTHKFVKDLTKAKMPPKQAEALAYHYASLLNDRIATKDDIRLLRSDFEAKIDAISKDLWIKVLSAQIATIVVIVGLLKYLP